MKKTFLSKLWKLLKFVSTIFTLTQMIALFF